MTLYEFLYTGIGQFIAAYAPNAVFAALVNPLLIAGESLCMEMVRRIKANLSSPDRVLWCLGTI